MDGAVPMRAQVLLSVQRALLGAVDPELRAVAVGWSDTSVEARFIYDATELEPFTETVSVAETEVIADFSRDVNVAFSAEALPIPAPLGLGPDEARVYFRRETP
jgi:hypothetical protein